jgi:hypothetical protein
VKRLQKHSTLKLLLFHKQTAANAINPRGSAGVGAAIKHYHSFEKTQANHSLELLL